MKKSDKEDFINSIFEVAQAQKTGTKCDCPCHEEGANIIHFMPCCYPE